MIPSFITFSKNSLSSCDMGDILSLDGWVPSWCDNVHFNRPNQAHGSPPPPPPSVPLLPDVMVDDASAIDVAVVAGVANDDDENKVRQPCAFYKEPKIK